MIDLWGNVDPHIQHSIALLKKHEPPEGYYLAFSGGKDSISSLVNRTVFFFGTNIGFL